MTAERYSEKVNEQPLDGRTILITRPLAQSAELTSLLEHYGARVIQCPVLEVVDPESYQPLDEAIENLYGYDWIIFTSVNGVDRFLTRLAAAGREITDLDDVLVCAIGDATAGRLRDHSIHVDVVPAQFKAEGIFEALLEYVGGIDKLAALNFLIPRAAVARDYLPRALAEAGARLDVVPAYRTVPPNNLEKRKIETLLLGGSIDCITFTSSSTVRNFAQLFDVTDLGLLLDNVVIACIGDVTGRTATEYGLKVDITPDETSAGALARSIAEYFSTF